MYNDNNKEDGCLVYILISAAFIGAGLIIASTDMTPNQAIMTIIITCGVFFGIEWIIKRK